MIELVLALLLSASQLTGLPMAGRLPTIEFMPERQMAERTYGYPLPRNRRKIRGQYSCYRNRLTLRDTWDKDSVASQSDMLHELVHHLQCADGGTVKMLLNCDVEAQAYRIEIVWLQKQGEDFYRLFGYDRDWFNKWLENSCGRVGQ